MAATCHAQEEDLFSKNLQKRYNGLLMVRTRAIKGKGAWYWSHLEPILFQNRDTGTAKAIKLRCGLCSALFSASNPSRTATEHLKRGTCPNFKNGISTNVANRNGCTEPKFQNYTQLALPSPLPQLAMIAAPCSSEQAIASPTRPHLNEDQTRTAFDLLADWFYESCGSVSFSCLDHPKFKAFLNHLGLPQINKAYISGRKLESKYAEAKLETEEKLGDTMFFQMSTNGWRRREIENSLDLAAFMNVLLNLPNGSSLFHKVLMLVGGNSNVDYIKEVLWCAIEESTGGNVCRCAGIVADINNVNNPVLRELESQHHWMVNLTCQSTALWRLLNDFYKRLPLFTFVASQCYKITEFLNSHFLNDSNFYFKSHKDDSHTHEATAKTITVVENISRCSDKLRHQILDDAESTGTKGKEISDMIQDPRLWRELDCVMSLTTLMQTMVQELDEERPCLGQCLPLWEEVRNRVKRWCKNFAIDEEPVMSLVNRRFSKNYHQAWSASFVLDPLYLVEDSSGRYLPPFKFLTSEQEKDVVKIITRLTQNEEAPIVLMELMKWRTEGLDPIYALAVQAKELDPVTGKLRVVNPRGSRLVWETYLRDFKVLRKVAARLIFLQATASRLGWNRSFLSWICSNSRSKNAIDKAQKVVFVSSHGKLARREFMDGEKDSELSDCSYDDMSCEVD